MKQYISQPVAGFALATIILSGTACGAPVYAQAIVEAGSLHAMPKPLSNSLKNPLRRIASITPRAASRPRVSNPWFEEEEENPSELAGQKSITIWHDAQKCEKSGQLEKAEALYRQCLSIRRSYWGDKDAAVPRLLTVIGNLDVRLHRWSSAETCYRDLLTIAAKKYGPGSWELSVPLKKLASLYSAQKNYSQAARQHELIFQLTERKYGKSHPITESAASTLAESLGKSATN